MFTRVRVFADGRRYLYEEERWREGRKVRSRSRCLGPVAEEFIGTGYIDALIEQYPGFPTRDAVPEPVGIAPVDKDQIGKAPAEETGAMPLTDVMPDVSPSEPGQPNEQSPSDAPSSEPSSEPGLPGD